MCLCCRRWDIFLTPDYVLLLALGGSDLISNIQPLCDACNTESECRLPLMDTNTWNEGLSPPEELRRRYREAKDPVERSHHHIAWLLAEGKSAREAAEATGYSERWVRELSRRYRESGVEGLGDRRHNNPGGAKRALLTPEQREELGEALKAPPRDGGLWSSRKVAEWIEGRTGRRGVRAQRGWEYLRKLGHTPQVPRPQNADADPAEQEAFKKSSPGA